MSRYLNKHLLGTYILGGPNHLITPYYISSVVINLKYKRVLNSKYNFSQVLELYAQYKKLGKTLYWVTVEPVDLGLVKNLGILLAIKNRLELVKTITEARLLVETGVIPDYKEVITGTEKHLRIEGYDYFHQTLETRLAQQYCNIFYNRNLENYQLDYPEVNFHQGKLTEAHLKELLNYRLLPTFYLKLETYRVMKEFLKNHKELKPPYWHNKFRRYIKNEFT